MQAVAPSIRRAGLVVCVICTATAAQEDGLVARRLMALRSIRLLPEAPANLFRRHADEFLGYVVAPGVAWPRDPELRHRNLWHHIDADAAAEQQNRDARLVAFRSLPRDKSRAERWFRGQGPNVGGELPWAIDKCHGELTEAYRAGDRALVLAWAGAVTHFVADATNPFRCSANDQGTSTGNPRFGSSHGAHPQSPDFSVRERFGVALVARHLSDYAGGSAERPLIVEPGLIPLVSAFDLIGDSLAVLDEVARVDREILEQLGVSDRKAFAARADAYYAELQDRCGDIRSSRLDAGASFAAALITDAWRAAGEPEADAVETEPASAWVASKQSDVFHLPTCPFVALIKQDNVVRFATRDEASKSGRRPCKHCQPQ